MRVWVDCTAAAHPLVLRPIIELLEAAENEVEVTTRSYGQTEQILERLGIAHTSVGEHGGGSVPGKAAALAGRSARLARWARGEGFDLALAHGSVDIAVVSRLLRIPLVQMNDYEHAGLQRKISFRAARLVMAPDAIGIEAMEAAGARRDRLFRYPGLKEDYYLDDFEPDESVLDSLGIDREKLLVVDAPAARDLRVPRAEPAVRRDDRPARRARKARPRWSSPAPMASASGWPRAARARAATRARPWWCPSGRSTPRA